MKRIILIVLLLLSIGCATTLKTEWGDIDFKLTPEMIAQMYDMATSSRDMTAENIASINDTAGKTIGIVDNVDGLNSWGRFDGVLSWIRKPRILCLKMNRMMCSWWRWSDETIFSDHIGVGVVGGMRGI